MPVPTIDLVTTAHLAWADLRCSPRTVANYRTGHTHLARCADSGAVPDRLDRWTPAHADSFARYLRDRGCQPSSVRTYLVDLRALVRWAVDQGYLRRDPLAAYRLPPSRPAHVPGYRPEDLAAMLAHCGPSNRGRRNAAILLLLFDTGLRAGECCALNVADVDLTRRTALVRSGKGGKARLVSFGDAAATALRRYLLRHHPDGDNPAAPLFWSRNGQPLTRRGLHEMVRALVLAAGLYRYRSGPHRIRHACAEQTLLNGGNVKFVQDLLGHSRIQTTERYVKFTDLDLRRQRAASSPADRIAVSNPRRRRC